MLEGLEGREGEGGEGKMEEKEIGHANWEEGKRQGMGGDAAGEIASVGRERAMVGGSQGSEKVAVPWFETLVEGSRLGRMKRRSGGGESSDGRIKVEWEVTEWTSSNDVEGSGQEARAETTTTVLGTGKRKLDETEGGDHAMRE